MYQWILPTRYLWKRRITLLAIAAVALCVFIVVVVMTVMNGLVEEFRGKNHRFVGDCVVGTESLVGFAYADEFLALLDRQDYIEGASPVVRGFGLMTQPGVEWNMGVEIWGLDLARHVRATDFAGTLYYHRQNPTGAFVPSYDASLPGCVIGIDMMQGRRNQNGTYKHPPQSSQYELIVSGFPLTPKGGLARAGTDLVNTLHVYFSDDSHSGLVKIDGRVVYLPYATAQELFGMAGAVPRTNAIHIRFRPAMGLEDGCNRIRDLWNGFAQSCRSREYANLLEEVRVQSWIENRRGAIAPMEKEQTMMIFLFLMLGVITVFIIFVVFYMIISHKSKDIGVLRCLGVSPAGVMAMVLIFASLVGIIGGGLGIAGGSAFLAKVNVIEDWLYQTRGWQVWNRSVYAIGKIPSQVQPSVLAMIGFSALLACWLGALIPALQAARKQPVEALRVGMI
jgi:lipoprotein-releasing system permease protein